jgi:hypothetical protein
MATILRSTLASLADNFASAVFAAIRSASLDELVAESGGAPGRPRGSSTTKAASTPARTSAPSRRSKGRLPRRSPADIAKALGQVVALVKGKKTGLRSEEIRKALRLDVREVPRVLREGLAKKSLRSKGQKRATTYFAA